MSTSYALSPSKILQYQSYSPVNANNKEFQSKIREESHYLKGSAVDWAPIVDATLYEICSNCNNENWDGFNASAISNNVLNQTALTIATLFVLLPKGTPCPDIVPEADGEICLTWYIDSSRLFSISIGDHGNINYAGQFGNKGATHGWIPIEISNSETIDEPFKEIAFHIIKLFA